MTTTIIFTRFIVAERRLGSRAGGVNTTRVTCVPCPRLQILNRAATLRPTASAKPDLPVLFARLAHPRKGGLPTSGTRAHFPLQSTCVPAAAAFLAPWRQRP